MQNRCTGRDVWQLCGHATNPTVPRLCSASWFRAYAVPIYCLLNNNSFVSICMFMNLPKAGSPRAGMTLWRSPVSDLEWKLVPKTVYNVSCLFQQNHHWVVTLELRCPWEDTCMLEAERYKSMEEFKWMKKCSMTLASKTPKICETIVS